jgi:protein translocase SecG subunit
VRDVVLYLVLIINLVSLVAMVAGILMHSGRGGGLSDMFGGGASAALGSSAAERNHRVRTRVVPHGDRTRFPVGPQLTLR